MTYPSYRNSPNRVPPTPQISSNKLFTYILLKTEQQTKITACWWGESSSSTNYYSFQAQGGQIIGNIMEWSKKNATEAYLDTIKLKCSKQKGRSSSNSSSLQTQEIESNEFLSALAAGMSAKVIVEIASDFSSSTIALAAAARQTGGKVVCILPEKKLDESQRVIEDTGLKNLVEFKTGDPVDVLNNIVKIDFSLIDCKADHYYKLLETLDVNPTRSVIVANNLVEGGKGLGGHLKRMEKQSRVTSMKHPIGKGMEITMIGRNFEEIDKCREQGGLGSGGRYSRYCSIDWRRRRSTGGVSSLTDKSKWIVEVDEKSGEEHIFRVPNHNC